MNSERSKKPLRGIYDERPDEMLKFETVEPGEIDKSAVPHTVDAAGNLLYQEPGVDKEALAAEEKKLLENALHILDSREQEVIKLRFGLEDGKEHHYPEIVAEVGPKYGFRHWQQAQGILNTAFRKLRISTDPAAIALRRYRRL